MNYWNLKQAQRTSEEELEHVQGCFNYYPVKLDRKFTATNILAPLRLELEMTKPDFKDTWYLAVQYEFIAEARFKRDNSGNPVFQTHFK
jgi:hypothetical protein